MNCPATLPLPLAAAPRPWWRRWWLAVPGPRGEAARPPADFRALEGLDRATLKDIGAPDWMWAAGRPGPTPWEVERARWKA